MGAKAMTVMDTVHGCMEIPAVVVAFVNTPEFQRLRDIAQLGLSKLVWPSAGHSRFEHSLGVSHLAGQLVEELSKRQPELGITPVDALCLRLAGLCHDLGHGPFSHTFERFVNTQRRLQGRPDRWHHEKASLDILDLMIHRNPSLNSVLEKEGITAGDVDFIKELIHPPKDRNFKTRGPKKQFLFEIISNLITGFDVDKLDYFLRDAGATGVAIPFNREDVNRLFIFASVKTVLNGSLRICYPPKMQEKLAKIGETRMSLHNTVYQHKTVLAYEILLLRVLNLAHKAGFTFRGADGKKYSLVDAVEEPLALLHLDDSILKLIRAAGPEDVSHPARLAAAQRILNHDIPYRLHPRLFTQAIGGVPHQFPTGFHTADEPTENNILRHVVQLSSQKAIDLTHLTAAIVHIHAGMREEDPVKNVYFFPDEGEGAVMKGDELEHLAYPRNCSFYKLFVFVDRVDEHGQEVRLPLHQNALHELFQSLGSEMTPTPHKPGTWSGSCPPDPSTPDPSNPDPSTPDPPPGSWSPPHPPSLLHLKPTPLDHQSPHPSETAHGTPRAAKRKLTYN